MIHWITNLIRFPFFKRKLESKSLRYIYRGEKFVYFFVSFKLCPIEGDQRRENSKFYQLSNSELFAHSAEVQLQFRFQNSREKQDIAAWNRFVFPFHYRKFRKISKFKLLAKVVKEVNSCKVCEKQRNLSIGQLKKTLVIKKPWGGGDSGKLCCPGSIEGF